ncbi:hypothetical protein [Sporosarcina koreensis]|uniref:hypothetical protein n=1 Tax=Sporosarcina koreensis TaxID=334735 RepID=UPI000AFBDD4F|nr:hypothetical protein [Sporosarcina koreensis]
MNGQAFPKANAFDIQHGEQSNFDQNCATIKVAHHSNNFEHQQIGVHGIVSNLS